MITFCIPTNNNLAYLKGCIESIKDQKPIYSGIEILVYVDDNNDTETIDWLRHQRLVRYLINPFDSIKGIAYGYNRCIEQAKNSLVCMFHADMVMGPLFVENMLKHHKSGVIVAGTRIEPPLHPAGPEKIVEDLGIYPNQFDYIKFKDRVTNLQQLPGNMDKTTAGVFAPWMAEKSLLLEIGMHDEEFHSYHEDSDIFNRLLLKGVEFKQSRDAFVYHYTCRGGQFKDGVDSVTKDPAFHEMKARAMQHFISKWHTPPGHDKYMNPIVVPKFSTQIVIPDRVVSTDSIFLNYDSLVNKAKGDYSVVLTIDTKSLSKASIEFGLTTVFYAIAEHNKIGTFNYEGITVQVNNLDQIQDQLIICNNNTTYCSPETPKQKPSMKPTY